MKKIIITILLLLFTSVSYSQYIMIDTLNNVVDLTTEQQRQINDIISGTSGYGYTNSQIDQLLAIIADDRDVEDARLLSILDSLGLRIKALEDGVPVIITPKPVTNLVVTAISSTSVTGTFTEPVDTGTYYFRYRIFSEFGDQLPYELIDTVQHGNTSFTVSGLLPSTIYQFDGYTIVSEVVSPSEYATADTAKTFDPAPPDPPAELNGWTYDVLVSLDGGGDTLTWAEAKALEGTLISGSDYVDTLGFAYGYYPESEVVTGNLSISFSASGTDARPIVYVSLLPNKERGVNMATGDTSVTFAQTLDDNPKFRISGDYREFYGINFVQNWTTTAKSLASVESTADSCVFDSCAFFHAENNISSSSNHTVTVYGKGCKFIDTRHVRGSRCGIWVRDANASGFIMDGSILTGMSNHPPIQIMPTTNTSDTTTMKRIIVRNCTFIDNSYSDGIYWRHLEQFAFYNNLFIRSSTPYSCDVHTGIYDSVNTKGGIIAYNTIVENTASNMIYNVAANQVNFVNNIFYTTATQDLIVRYGNVYTPQLRHNNDYNLIYSTVETYPAGWRYTWNGSTSTGTVYFANTGQGEHEVYTAPTFTDAGNDDYSPLDDTSDQVGIGIPITTANGFWMNITTDRNGNPRDGTAPTAGAYEYVAP